MSHTHSHPSADQLLAQALRTLRANGGRVTLPRRAILELLVREHGPFSAEEVHRRLKKRGGDLVTCYRTLTAMEEQGILRRCDFGDGTYRYEINTGEHHHHHIICRQCRKVQTLDVCFAEGLEKMARELGYDKVTHTLEAFGTCPDCQQRQTAS